ncbi:MAG: WD40 repeat domain-containing protein [Alphaproteobacteria bacterium]|nr:WD40 repeat domain-containing protein [Alphaproteobacteria bacterium]
MSQKPSSVCRRWSLGKPVLDAVINRRGDWVLGAFGDGSLTVIPAEDSGEEPKLLQAHDGVSLCLAPDADDHGFLSGGDDGRVFLVDPGIAAPTLLVEHKGKWIEHVAGAVDGHRAYSSGKTLYRLDENGEPCAEPTVLPGSIGGLSFSPDGKRLAATYYGGVQLFSANAPTTPPDVLEWKGSHLGLVWSPDGQFLLTAMQDASLHGWKLGAALKSKEAGNEMHMQGYEAKIQSMAFTAQGKYLATSGAAQTVCWPFFDGGPWEKQPMLLGSAESRLVTRVAPHPTDGLTAAGYNDGMIVLAPFDGRMEIMIHPPYAPSGAAVIGLAWSREGDCLTAIYENGIVNLFTLASISRSVRGKFG